MEPATQDLSDVRATPVRRADAVRNRERVAWAARDAFAEFGIDAPITEVARRAGLGTATVYRHFASKQALVLGAFEDQLAACAAAVDDALDDPDPWHAFRTCVERLCEIHAMDRGFTAAFLSAYPDTEAFATAWRRGERVLAEVVRRAQASGDLRPDYARDDLTLLLMAIGGIAAGSAESSAAAARRLVAYVLPSMRTRPGTDGAVPLPPAVPLGLHFDVDE
jgi:AcrR family transcriptional regulator